VWLVSNAHAATTISGTVYQDNGTTPIPGIRVDAIQGTPCEWREWIASDTTDGNGYYEITLLLEGTYYLWASNNNTSNYVNEWHTGGVPDPSSYDCNLAVEVTVTDGTPATGINFNLDMGGAISGTVADSAGNLIDGTGTPISVNVFTGDSCGWRQCVGGASQDEFGAYKIWGVPVGTSYYLQTDNRNQSNYVNEWHTGGVPDPSSLDCNLAAPVTVSENVITPGKNFKLDMGGSVSGIVYQGGSVAEGARVAAWQTDDPCEDRQWIADAWTDVNGEYKIWGLPLPATGTCYLQTQNENEYADEWYAATASTYYCYEAEEILVSQGVDTAGYNFQLDIGATISGIVVDEGDAAQEGMLVEYWNDACSLHADTSTDSYGSFEIIGLPPGPSDIEILPEVSTGLVFFKRHFYLNDVEEKDFGTIKLQQGALISGFIKDATPEPLPDIKYQCGGRFDMGKGKTGSDGSFALRLPPGEYALGLDDNDDYTMVTKYITVTDVGSPVDLGTLTAYDDVNGETVSGTVNVTGVIPEDMELAVDVFLNSQTFTTDNIGGICSLSWAIPDAVTGSYSLFVPPTTARPDSQDVMVLLTLQSEGPDRNFSITTLDVIADQTTPAGSVDFSYTVGGYTVDGYVKDNDSGDGIFFASVLLYRQGVSGDEFAGFAETDHTGKYTFYNVPAADYKVAVTHPDYDDAKWSNYFDVVATNVNVEDILMGGGMDELAIDFKTLGIYVYDAGSWNKIYQGVDPERLCSFGTNLAVDFGTAYGLYVYDAGAWTSIYKGVAIEKMTGFGGKLAVDFGAPYGLYVYEFDTDTWNPIYKGSALRDTIEALGDKLVVDFMLAGIYVYDAGSWNKIYQGVDPFNIVSFGDKLAVDFGTAYGLYVYEFDTDTWTRVYKGVAAVEMMAKIDGDLAVDFGPYGLYVYEFDTDTWTRVYKGVAAVEKMAGFDGNLAIDFGIAYGLYVYEFDTDTWNPIYKGSAPMDELVPANIFD